MNEPIIGGSAAPSGDANPSGAAAKNFPPRTSLRDFHGGAYPAALQQERENRDFSFLELPFVLGASPDRAGIPIRQITLRQLLVRLNIDCPFMTGRVPEVEDIAEFLWFLSPDFQPGSGDSPNRHSFIKKVAQLPYDEAVKEIDRYLDLVFLDAPPSGGKHKTPIASAAATLIDIFASEYGWSRDVILDSPVPQLYQLLREIELRHKGKDAVFINRLSDKVKAQWQEALSANKSTGGSAAPSGDAKTDEPEASK
jgi:hypothetical protein